MPSNSTFRSLRQANPEIAIGLGYSKSDATPQICVEGPLWRGTSKQVGQGARWHIGSITKTITATIALQLVDQGKLDLDRPVGDTFKNPGDMHEGWRAITLFQLLSHTSGLAANPTRRQLYKWQGLDAVTGRQKVLSDAWTKPPKF